MNMQIVKCLLLSALVCSAVIAVAIVTIDLYGFHTRTDKLTNYVYNENSATTSYTIENAAGARYVLCGDDVGGGHP